MPLRNRPRIFARCGSVIDGIADKVYVILRGENMNIARLERFLIFFEAFLNRKDALSLL